jgi:hypothetical protein
VAGVWLHYTFHADPYIKNEAVFDITYAVGLLVSHPSYKTPLPFNDDSLEGINCLLASCITRSSCLSDYPVTH